MRHGLQCVAKLEYGKFVWCVIHTKWIEVLIKNGRRTNMNVKNHCCSLPQTSMIPSATESVYFDASTVCLLLIQFPAAVPS